MLSSPETPNIDIFLEFELLKVEVVIIFGSLQDEYILLPFSE